MSKNYETGIDPNLKEQINKEGWETGKDYNLKTEEEKEGGAAVFVGAKEEAEKAREIAETEGKAANLGAYIDMHKVIKVESDEMKIPDEYKKTIFAGKGWLKDEGRGAWFSLLYIDSDGNIVDVDIRREKIASYIYIGKRITFYDIKQELEEKEGFVIESVEDDGSSGYEYGWALEQINKKQKKLNEEAKESRKKGFNH